MVYQKPLAIEKPYSVSAKHHEYCAAHRHCEIEIMYCVRGGCEINVGGKKHELGIGDIAVISSMEVHEFIHEYENSRILVIEIGPNLIGEDYGLLAVSFGSFIVRGSDSVPLFDPMRENIRCLDKSLENKSAVHGVETRGYLLLIFSELYEYVSRKNNSSGQLTEQELRILRFIDDITGYVNSNYMNNIHVEDAACFIGYSRSHFCRLFSEIYSMGFHDYLNQVRIRNAEYMLCAMDIPVSEVAELSGFSDVKSLCRSFQLANGISPSKYRQKIKIE